jgi:hypothetical protein
MASPTKTPLLLFAFFTLFYFVSMPGYLQVSDSEYSLKTAQSLLHRGTFEIERTPQSEGYVFVRDGRAYSKFGIGLALLWVPFVAVAGMVAHISGLPAEFVTHFVVSTYSIFFGALACVLFHRLAGAFCLSASHALLLTLAFGLGTIIWKYSVYDFSEIVQTCALLGATLAALRNTPRSLALMAACLSANVFMKVAAVIYLPVFFAYVWWVNRHDARVALRKLGAAAVVGGIFGAVLLYLNYVRFGNPLESGYGGQAVMFSDRFLHNLAALLISPEKGLFLYSPILLFAVAGYPAFVARHRAEAGLFVALALINLCFHASYIYYEGGWCWGPRFQVVITYLLLLPAGMLLDRWPAWRPAFFALFAISTAVQSLAVLEKDQEYHTLRTLILQDRSQPMPAPILGHWVVLRHKLTKGDTIYPAREFGLRHDETLDASGYSTFQGLNLWYGHVARSLGLGWLKWTPVLAFPLLAWLLWRVLEAPPP